MAIPWDVMHESCEYCGRNDLPFVVGTGTLKDNSNPNKTEEIKVIVCIDCLEEKDGRILH